MSDKETFKQELDARTAEIEQLIGTYLPEETGHQKTIFEAMNYSMKAGGYTHLLWCMTIFPAWTMT